MKQPQPVSDLLKGILRDLGTARTRADLQDALARAVGGAAASSCCVAGLRGGKLVVEVSSAPLYAELSGFRADEIRRSINEVLGKPEVGTILFRMGGTANV